MTAASYTDTAVTAGSPYAYRVVSLGGGGASTPSVTTVTTPTHVNSPLGLDRTLDNDGIAHVAHYASAIVVQSDGKVVVAAKVYDPPRVALARYNADGTVDSSFGSGGLSSGDFLFGAGTYVNVYGLALQSDGKVLAAGEASTEEPGVTMPDTKMFVARFNADGTLDTTFGNAGRAEMDLGTYQDAFVDVAVTNEGLIVGAGSTEYLDPSNATLKHRAVVARFTAAGVPDATFDADGYRVEFSSPDSAAGKVLVQPDGKIVTSGLDAFVRYLVDGTLDVSFGGGDGRVNGTELGGAGNPGDMDLLSDGRIVAAFHNGIRRFTADGTFQTQYPDPVFLSSGGIAVLADNSVVTAGGYPTGYAGADVVAWRYGPDGQPMAGPDGRLQFDPSGHNIDDTVYAMAVALSGEVVIASTYFGNNTAGMHEEGAVLAQFNGDSPVKLDIDGDGTIGANDRLAEYTPGYGFGPGGPVPKLSPGTFKDPQYVGQKMKWIVQRVPDGFGQVVFTLLDDVTHKPGFAENASDLLVEGADFDDDYSFAELADLRQKTVNVDENGKASVDFWAKDYGGRARIRVEAKQGANLKLIQNLTIPLDSDLDEIADVWEREQVEAWNKQFGKTEAKDARFFLGIDDKELRDPDGPNTDGGTDLPEHKEAGDNLFVSEEYRGYLLDGGHGSAAHPGGHTRLSPAFKEFLVEVDRMTGVQKAPDAAGIKAVMNEAAAGFIDATNGAGVRMYWVLDEIDAPQHVAKFPNVIEQNNWSKARHNPKLRSFVHLAFSNDGFPLPDGTIAYGQTGFRGAHVYVKPLADDTFPGQLPGALATLAAHELTHILLRNVGDEHQDDGNDDGLKDQLDDKSYLMYRLLGAQNWGSFLFDKFTRGDLSLLTKDFSRL